MMTTENKKTILYDILLDMFALKIHTKHIPIKFIQSKNIHFTSFLNNIEPEEFALVLDNFTKNYEINYLSIW